jgi:hypothetical protein
MDPERYEQIVARLEKARRSWNSLHDIYVRFRERAKDMADAQCVAKGIIPQSVGDDLYVQYLDRRLRISFAFDRISDRGILCVEICPRSGSTRRAIQFGLRQFCLMAPATWMSSTLTARVCLCPTPSMLYSWRLASLTRQSTRTRGR